MCRVSNLIVALTSFIMLFFSTACHSSETELHFKMHEEFVPPVVTVKIPKLGSKEFRFLLDTGSSNTILSEQLYKKFNLVSEKKIQFETNIIEGTSEFQDLGFADISLTGETEITCLSKITSPTNYSENTSVNRYLKKFDGILGLDFFNNTVLKIDGPLKTIVIEKKLNTCGAQLNTTNTSNVDFIENRFLKAHIHDKVYYLFPDSGNILGIAVLLFADENGGSIWNELDKNFVFTQSKTFNTEASKFVKETIINDVVIGQSKIEDLLVLIYPPDSIKITANDDFKFGGIISWNLMSEGVSKFDFINNTPATFELKQNFKLLRNKLGFRNNFVWNSDGAILIKELDDGSPGKRFGLQNGDIIMSINDIVLTKNPKNSLLLRQLLSGVNGNELKLKVLRNKNVQTINVILDDYLNQDSLSKIK